MPGEERKVQKISLLHILSLNNCVTLLKICDHPHHFNDKYAPPSLYIRLSVTKLFLQFVSCYDFKDVFCPDTM